ncbi:MAG: alpha/beta hydrolase [Fimbriimonadales bacterium]
MTLVGRHRSPLNPSSGPPLLVLLHGLAADENDLIGIASDLDPRFHVVSLRAPYEAGYGGYAWFDLQFLPDGRRLMDQKQAVASLDIIISDLIELIETISPSRVVIAGFSQGAMMAAGVVLNRPELVHGAWLMSSRYLPALDPRSSPARILPVYMQHGLEDQVLRVSEGRELAEVLTRRGHIVAFDEYAMGHETNYQSLMDADLWLRVLIGG